MKSKLNLYLATLVAFLIAMPLSEKAVADSGLDIAGAALDLGFAIADVAGGS